MSDPIEKYKLRIEDDNFRRPIEWIIHAYDHLIDPTDFDLRQAYILLDCGLESLFKTYFSNDERSKADLREILKIEQGQYYSLVSLVRKHKPDIYNKYDLGKLSSYRRQRNRLYHDPNETRHSRVGWVGNPPPP